MHSANYGGKEKWSAKQYNRKCSSAGLPGAGCLGQRAVRALRERTLFATKSTIKLLLSPSLVCSSSDDSLR